MIFILSTDRKQKVLLKKTKTTADLAAVPGFRAPTQPQAKVPESSIKRI